MSLGSSYQLPERDWSNLSRGVPFQSVHLRDAARKEKESGGRREEANTPLVLSNDIVLFSELEIVSEVGGNEDVMFQASPWDGPPTNHFLCYCSSE